MTSKPTQRLGYRVAEESQLLAEEKWLIEALEKIKKQRNCLQIERLHLESLRAKLNQTNDPQSSREEPTPTTSTAPPRRRSIRNSIEFEVPVVTETSCNEEELNLAVTKSVFEKDYDIEEYEEDDDDCEDVMIDINMLMNGKMQ